MTTSDDSPEWPGRLPEASPGHRHLDSPVAIRPAPIDSRRPWRWGTAAILVATLLLAVANAKAVADWFDELTPEPINLPMRAPVAWWADATRGVGLDAPRAWLRGRWTAARGLRFGAEQPGQKGAAAGE